MLRLLIGSLILITVMGLTGCQYGGAQPEQAVSSQPTAQELPTSRAPTALPPPSVLTKRIVKDAVQRQAVCNDGTPAVYYFKRGSDADANHWLIFLEGGGWCSNGPACTYRWSSLRTLMTSQGAPDTLTMGGILSTSVQYNPDFANFTQVYVKYCSSDMYSGDGQQQVNGKPMQFRGHKIVAALIADLEDPTTIPAPNLKNASEVLLGGSSAGSYGAASNLDWLAAQLPWANVKGVLDSSWVPLLPDYGSGVREPMPGSADFTNYYSAVADQSCAAANPSQPQVCLPTLQLYPYLTTPVFIYADQRDPTLSQIKGVNDPNDPAQAAYMTQYAASLRQSLKSVPAVFSPSAGIHTALTDDNFTAIKVNGYDFQQLLGNWYFGRSGPVRVIAGETP